MSVAASDSQPIALVPTSVRTGLNTLENTLNIGAPGKVIILIDKEKLRDGDFVANKIWNEIIPPFISTVAKQAPATSVSIAFGQKEFTLLIFPEKVGILPTGVLAQIVANEKNMEVFKSHGLTWSFQSISDHCTNHLNPAEGTSFISFRESQVLADHNARVRESLQSFMNQTPHVVEAPSGVSGPIPAPPPFVLDGGRAVEENLPLPPPSPPTPIRSFRGEASEFPPRNEEEEKEPFFPSNKRRKT